MSDLPVLQACCIMVAYIVVATCFDADFALLLLRNPVVIFALV
jgi:hypothetical protein